MNKLMTIFLIILVLGIVLRIGYLDKAFIGDESHFIEAAQNLYDKGTPIAQEANLGNEGVMRKFTPHPPLFILLIGAPISMFGMSNLTPRLIPLIFGILSIVMVYLVAKLMFNKKTALLAMLLFAISTFAVQQSQIIDIDGSVFTFFLLTFVYAFLRWHKKPTMKTLLWMIPTLYLTAMSKFAMILIVATVLIFLILMREWKKLKYFLIIGIVTAVLFYATLVAASAAFNADFISGSLLQGSSYFFAPDSPLRSLSVLSSFIGMYLLIVGTPILALTFLYIFEYKRKKKKIFTKFHIFLTIWTAIFTVFYLFIRGPWYRYLIPMLPAFYICFSSFLIKFNWKKHWRMIVLISFVLFVALGASQLRTDLPFLKAGASALFLTVLLLPFLIALLVVTPPKKTTAPLMILLISMIFSYSFYFALDSTLFFNSPDHRQGTVQMAEYLQARHLAVQDYIISPKELAFYMDVPFYDILVAFPWYDNFDQLAQDADFYIYSTYHGMAPQLEEYANTYCTLIQRFYDKEILVSAIYTC